MGKLEKIITEITPEQIQVITNSIIKLVILFVFVFFVISNRHTIGEFFKKLTKFTVKALGLEASANFSQEPKIEKILI